MFNHKTWISIAALLFTFTACSEDAAKTAPYEPEQPTQQGNPPVSETPAKAQKGETCGDNIQCADNLTCKDNVCVDNSESPNPQPGPEDNKCTSDESCGEDMKCDQGVCKKIAHTGDACDETAYCEGSSCEEGICRIHGAEGDACDNNANLCEADLICTASGKCQKPAQLGKSCDDSENLCDSSYICKDSVCIQIAAEGENCGSEIFTECNENDNLVCTEGKCTATSSEQSCDETGSCPDGQLCSEGKCKPVSTDGTCDEATVCPEGQICSGGSCIPGCSSDEDCTDSATRCCTEDECTVKNVCVPKEQPSVAKKGEACDETIQCDTNLTCKDNICVDESETPENKCSSDDDCGSGMKCDQEACKTIAHAGDACGEKVWCEDSTCEDGTCIHYGSEGDACDKTANLCKSELVCAKSGFCRKPAQLGEKCEENDNPCKNSLACSNGICVKEVSLGEACGPEIFAECKYDNLMCLDGKCKITSFTQSCDEITLCPATQVCVDGTCITKKGCTSDEECVADTYCCTEDTCETKNVCIPYGMGPRPPINESCQYKTVPGLFEAAIQCEWTHTTDTNQYPNHANVLMTPLVMDTPHVSGQANEIIFTTYNNSDGGAPSGQGSSIDYYGVIRIINAETCALHESIFDNNNRVIGGSNLAMADLDGNGTVEIVASRGSAQPSGATAGGGLVVFQWNNETKKYETKCNTTKHSASTLNWGGPAIHDINDDGKPELIGFGGEVFDADCKRLNEGQTISELSYTPTLGDLDNDGNIEIIGTSNVYRWSSETNTWSAVYTKAVATGIHPAFADFGTRKPDGSFDFEHFDGVAETVGCGSSKIELSTLQGEKLLDITFPNYYIGSTAKAPGGGPCTVGDFDGDGLPEIATAFGDMYRVLDPRCKKDSGGNLPKGCFKEYILWEKTSQDASSASTGSSLFDFDGDGAMEAVYADECYTRVYDGKTGDVLFSAFRSSGTWHEYPVIADVDNDESAEIVVGSNNKMTCASPDPIHRGLRCATNDDCKSKNCVNGLCRCSTSGGAECNSRTDMDGNILNEYNCVAPLAGDEAGGNVCRAIRNNADRVTGVRVMRDRLDRWTSSRPLWNQHAYSITNINDDMTVPKTSSWIQNFLSTSPFLNNFRQNVQGARGKNTAPDITGKLDKNSLCTHTMATNTVTLHGVVCNRGTKAVASQLPASFYQVNSDGTLGQKFCTAYTSANVPLGNCLAVSCNIEDVPENTLIRMVTNDDGNGGQTTVECNTNNNTDEVMLSNCQTN